MKNIIFDLGGVLILWDPDIVYKKHFAGDSGKISRFYEETRIYEVNAQMDRGKAFQEALTELSNKFPHYHTPIHLWNTQWLDMINGQIEGSVKILESLHSQGYPLYALTNWAAEKFYPHIRHNYKFLNLFKDIVVSADEKIIKPESEIYELLLRRNKLDPKNCIYIDDKQENLIPAQNLGMATIEFTSPEQLTTQLEEHGVSTR
jgi:2-haloacid dehalogenase